MRVWITGVSGLLGLHMAWETLARGWEVFGTARRQALPAAPFPVVLGDLTDPDFLDWVWEQAQPQLIVHTAALAHVDACEQDPQTAYRINAWLPGQLAQRAAREGIPLVHISTDAVFDGQRGQYTEEDRPNPLSVYGKTKLQGERAVLEAYPQALVLRVNFFGWSLSGKRSLVEWFLGQLRERQRRIPGFADVWFCPLLANHLACLILLCVERGLTGLYHAVASQCLTKFEFGRLVAQAFGFPPERIQPVSVEEAGLRARRAHHLTLRVDKLTQDLGMTPPSPQEGLRALVYQEEWGYPRLLRRWVQEQPSV